MVDLGPLDAALGGLQISIPTSISPETDTL